MFFNDPIELERFITPIAGPVLIRPAIGASFNAKTSIKRLEHIGFFSIAANSFKAVKDAQLDFYGLTIPLSAPFTVLQTDRNQEYELHSAHLLSPGQTFNFTAKRKCHSLIANFFADPVSHYSRKLLQSDSQDLPALGTEVSFFNQAGSILLRSGRSGNG